MSANSRKGARFETDVVDFLRHHDLHHAERRVQGGNADRGDIGGVPGWCFELKNHQELRLAEWMDEAVREAAHCDDGLNEIMVAGGIFVPTIPAVIHKRRRKSIGEAYFTMRLKDAVRLVKESE